MKDKVSITKYAQQIAQERGDEADAVMIVRLNGNLCETSIVGLDPLCISNAAVCLADSLKTTLDMKFGLAQKILAEMKQRNMFASEAIDASKTVKCSCGCHDMDVELPSTDELAEALASFAKEIFGKGDGIHAHDD